MKTISLLSHLFIESTGPQPADYSSAEAITRAVYENRNKVIGAGLFVERELEAIIVFYLFPGADLNDKKDFFSAEILRSDAVAFSHKKRLILSLVSQQKWLEGEARSSFDRYLKKVISFRNAFAHGDIIVRDSVAFVEFFEGGKKKVELSDAYWSDLESTFHSLVKCIEAVKTAAGMRLSRPDDFQ